MAVLLGAKDFCNIFLSKFVGLTKELVSIEREAWARSYGIHFHAWNMNFFKLGVMA